MEMRRQMVDEWSYHEPMVGQQYQAHIPNLLKRCRENRYSLQRQAILQQNYKESEEGKLVWDCHRHDPEVVDQYLKVVKDWATLRAPAQSEHAPHKLSEESMLDFLHANGGRYEQAIASLKLGYSALCRPAVVWESAEVEAFLAAYDHYGRDFRAIADALPRKSWKQVADFYFRHKSDENQFNMPKPGAATRGLGDFSPPLPSPGAEITAEEDAIAKAGGLAPSKLLALKQQLVDLSAHEGSVSKEKAFVVSNQQDSVWVVKNTSRGTVDALFELLVSRQLIRASEE
eukprot:TRINITY_DN15535_c0_g1_i2.p1 TRINITY_DN15535_c0_g1~~TRINITY_DN15535_c0_g1_i2.p1  ORF type:complete len:287 (-),score=78.93 TRINITY_DN15535_c0_g1_i2:538-1398(-)